MIFSDIIDENNKHKGNQMRDVRQELAEKLYDNKVKLGILVGNPITQAKSEFVNDLLAKSEFINPEIPLLSKIEAFKQKTGRNIEFFTLIAGQVTEKQQMASYLKQFEVESFLIEHGFSAKVIRDHEFFDFSISDESNRVIARLTTLGTYEFKTGIVDNEFGKAEFEIDVVRLEPFEGSSKIVEMGQQITDYESAKLADMYDLIGSIVIVDDRELPVSSETLVDGDPIVTMNNLDSKFFMDLLRDNIEVLEQVSALCRENHKALAPLTLESEYTI
jgi:hypothetical protein